MDGTRQTGIWDYFLWKRFLKNLFGWGSSLLVMRLKVIYFWPVFQKKPEAKSPSKLICFIHSFVFSSSPPFIYSFTLPNPTLHEKALSKKSNSGQTLNLQKYLHDLSKLLLSRNLGIKKSSTFLFASLRSSVQKTRLGEQASMLDNRIQDVWQADASFGRETGRQPRVASNHICH